MSEYTQLPQKETDEEMMVLNYKFLRYPSASKAVFVLICLLTAGIAFLIDNWFYPIRRLKFR